MQIMINTLCLVINIDSLLSRTDKTIQLQYFLILKFQEIENKASYFKTLSKFKSIKIDALQVF